MLNIAELQKFLFDLTRKMMTTFNENLLNEKIVSCTKGAPDIVITIVNIF